MFCLFVFVFIAKKMFCMFVDVAHVESATLWALLSVLQGLQPQVQVCDASS